MTEKLREQKLKTQFLFFSTIFFVVDFLFWGFYAILLYRETQSFLVLSIDTLVYFICLYIGVLWGGVLLEKKGYRDTFRLLNAISSIAMVLIFLFLPHLGSVFAIFSLLRGIIRGGYWSINKSFMLRENKGQNRERFLSVFSSIYLIISVITPIVSGFLIDFGGGYEVNLLFAAILFLFAAVFPWKYNKNTRSNFSLSELTSVFEMRGFKSYSIINILNGFNDMVPVFIFSIVPFLIIKDEFGVGIFVGLISILGALVLYLERNEKIKNRLKTGIASFFIEGLGAIFFLFNWTFLGLTVRSIASQFFGNLGLAVFDDVDFENRDAILGKSENESGVEFNLLTESMLLIGRVTSVSLFIVLFSVLKNDIEATVKVFLGVSSFWNLAILLMQVRLKKWLKPTF